MKRLKKKYRFFLNIIIFGMVFIGLFALQGCKGISLVSGKSSETQSGTSAGESGNSGTQDKNSNTGSNTGEQAAGVPDNSANNSAAQDNGTDISQEASGADDTNKNSVFITWLDENNSFAFQYPADKLTLSSNVFVAAGTSTSKLSVMKNRLDSVNSGYYYLDKKQIEEDIAALKKGNFGADIQYSYKPGQKVRNIDGRFLKEFMIFSRSDCDVCFERVMVFYDDGFQYLVISQGDTNTLKESLSDYLVTDNKDCQGLASWGQGKIDALYSKLINGSAPEKVQQWYDSFDGIAANIVFDSSKITSLEKNSSCTVTGKSIYENMPERKTEITASYPVFEDRKTPGLFDDVNSHIKGVVDPWIAKFMDSTADVSQNMPAGAAWILQLQTDYAVEYLNGIILSLSFTDYAFTGGAHGGTISSTYDYDLVNKKEISLSDIFKPGSDYLKFLSDYSFEDIKRQNTQMGMDSMEDMIKPGVDPLIPENFARFILTADSLIIRFDQYQVGPGAAGSYSVSIGYEKIKDLLNEDYAVILLK